MRSAPATAAPYWPCHSCRSGSRRQRPSPTTWKNSTWSFELRVLGTKAATKASSAQLNKQSAWARGAARRRAHIQLRAPDRLGVRRRTFCPGEHDAAIAAIVRLPYRGVDAHFGGDAAHHQIVDFPSGEEPREAGRVERTLAGLVDDRLAGQRVERGMMS